MYVCAFHLCNWCYMFWRDWQRSVKGNMSEQLVAVVCVNLGMSPDRVDC
jgi:hypothetical protein